MAGVAGSGGGRPCPRAIPGNRPYIERPDRHAVACREIFGVPRAQAEEPAHARGAATPCRDEMVGHRRREVFAQRSRVAAAKVPEGLTYRTPDRRLLVGRAVDFE